MSKYYQIVGLSLKDAFAKRKDHVFFSEKASTHTLHTEQKT